MSDAPSKIKLFESNRIRSQWDDEAQTWWFSVVDVIGALTESTNPTDYLKKLRKRDALLGSYLGTNCPQVAMQTESGKLRKTLAASTEQLLRIVQSIPSPKAEPFKLWLAQVGAQTAKAARLQLEKSTGRKVVSPRNAKQLGTQQAPEKPLLPAAAPDAPKENDDA
ncbi:Bro-N domain-containing protein [Comamonas denitrificans]|jgi:prophage antirepressor-like protein|uniref:BRO-N domain-containing protein n=1 Tax=Comamonas denitrificans TaxID=117506 RepID=UPI003616607B